MPAQSQNLTFTINSTSTVSVNYPNTGTGSLTLLSTKIKGDGYFSGSDGNHTVQIQTTNFLGKIDIEASLAADPGSADWFPVTLYTNIMSVDTTGLIQNGNTSTLVYNTATSEIKAFNFVGNYVWVRGKIHQFTSGSVNGIRYNY